MAVYMLADLDLTTSGAPVTHFIGLLRGFATIHESVVGIVRRVPVDVALVGLDNPNIRLYEIRLPNVRGLRHVLWDLRAHRRLRKIVDLRHSNDPVEEAFIYERFGTFSVLGPITANHLGMPYVAEFNGLTGQELLLGGYGKTVASLGDWTDKWHFQNCDIAVCVTEGIRQSLIEVTERQWEGALVVHNAVDSTVLTPRDKLACRDELGWDRDKFILGFVGNLAPWQGLEELVSAVSRLPCSVLDDLEIRIVGGGSNRLELEQRVDAFGLQEIIRFEGHVSWTDIPGIIPAFDMGFINRVGLEGGFTPIKLFEYMSCGVPCLARSMPGISDIIEESGAGILFSTPSELTAILNCLVGKPQDLRSMGHAGRSYIEDGHTWTDVAIKTTDAVLGSSNVTL